MLNENRMVIMLPKVQIYDHLYDVYSIGLFNISKNILHQYMTIFKYKVKAVKSNRHILLFQVF
ncbi:MAG: hypothetical protein K0Q49_2267 [Haloplasmataceae bacterium]|jgi:hypothetical protein|nr:hypothetical protein [Haloplasmataceae bacterium]